jgi:NADH-quinone oxidoreductase subunit I
VLDRFAIDWSLCMYCGICVEECPFDALAWSADLASPAETLGALVAEKSDLTPSAEQG